MGHSVSSALLLGAVIFASLFAASETFAQRIKNTPGNESIAEHLKRGGQRAQEAPERRRGAGPYKRLIIRGGTVIDGTGAPPLGPVDMVIEGDTITTIKSVGNPGADIDPNRRPEPGDREIDAAGHYILPGFINAHAHISYPGQSDFGPPSPAEYVYKLWLAHGITTVREVGSGNGLSWTVAQKQQSAAYRIAAPRILAYAGFRGDMTPKEASSWIKKVASAGADGVKFFGAPPDVMRAALNEIKKLGLRSAMHHAQLAVVDMNVLDSARMGLNSMEHWYGLPEALFDDKRIQHYPAHYNYNNEQHRFGQAGRLWRQAAKPGSERWNKVMEELLALDFTLDPTLTIYEASRDVMRARNVDWMQDYAWPTLWRFFQPSRTAHGSFWLDWTTGDEVAWRENFRIWMQFLNEYKNRGGRVTTGEDAGFIYKVYGFAYIRELELLQEAGFHPLEVIRSATLNGAQLLGLEQQIGTLSRGKRADLVIVDQNPLHNFKVLYGTGAIRFNDEKGEMERVGGIKHTIKDGIVYNAKTLLADVKAMVATQKNKEATAQ